MSGALLPIALSTYGVGMLLAGWGVFRRSEAARGGASAFFVVGWLAHTAAVAQRWVGTGRLPLSGLAEFLLVLAWAVMGLHLLLWFGWRLYAAGLVLPPLVILAGSAALPLLAAEVTPPGSFSRGWFLLHTTLSTLGMATLCVALAMSLIYLFQDRALKSHRTLGLLERLPSLERCDRIGFRALAIGFVLLTLGIGTGIVVNTEIHARLWSGGFKQTSPLAAWAVFAAVLVARRKLGLRGRKSAYLTIAGVALGLLAVVGMTR